MHKIEIKEDKGSPWQCKPLLGKILPLCWQFIRTWYWIDVMHRIIQSIHVAEKPVFSMTTLIKFNFTWSYALLMSVLITIHLFLPLGFVMRAWKISWAIIILYVICLPAAKADWFFDTQSGHAFFNIWKKTLAIIL